MSRVLHDRMLSAKRWNLFMLFCVDDTLHLVVLPYWGWGCVAALAWAFTGHLGASKASGIGLVDMGRWVGNLRDGTTEMIQCGGRQRG